MTARCKFAVLRSVFLSFCMALAMHASAQPISPQQGVHYQELPDPLPDANPDVIDVMELFWYGCASCYDLLPTLQIWESSYRSFDMNFSRSPVVWNPIMETHARIYLTADVLGMIPVANKGSWDPRTNTHNVIYAAIHDESRPLRSMDEAAEFFSAQGVAREKFEQTWNSEAVHTRLESLKAMPGADAIARLPALVVDGRYVITYNEAVKTSDELFKVLSELVVQIREVKRKAAR